MRRPLAFELEDLRRAIGAKAHLPGHLLESVSICQSPTKGALFKPPTKHLLTDFLQFPEREFLWKKPLG